MGEPTILNGSVDATLRELRKYTVVNLELLIPPPVDLSIGLLEKDRS